VHKIVINSEGLGDTPAITPQTTALTPGTIWLCNSWAYWITIPCWQLSPQAWAEAAALPHIPTPTAGPGVPPTALTDPNAVLADTSGTIGQTVSNQQITQEQQDTGQWASEDLPDTPLGTDTCEQWTANWPEPFNGMTCPTTFLYAGVAVLGILIVQKMLAKI
jgi:hypothetical protein